MCRTAPIMSRAEDILPEEDSKEGKNRRREQEHSVTSHKVASSAGNVYAWDRLLLEEQMDDSLLEIISDKKK